MATGSGLDAQLAIGVEAEWGTPVIPDRAYEFTDESLTMEPEWLEPTALRAGQKYKRANRVRQSRRTVSGDFTVEHATRGMGRLWRHALGSPVVSPQQLAASTAYQQAHRPGDFRGLGLTIQVGRPEPATGSIRPFTYEGCKVNSWEFSVRDQEIPTLALTVDGRNESTGTALAVASYLADTSVFDFSQATLKLGGTVSTVDGLTVVTGGAAASTIIREFSVAGEVPMATERFGLGNAGLKSEQLENDTPTITGSLGAEFNRADLYDAFANNTTQALEIVLTGEPIGDSGYNTSMSIILPAIKIKSAAPNVGGPDIVEMDTGFEAYADEVNPVIQVLLITDESTL